MVERSRGKEQIQLPPEVAVIMGSDSDLPVMSEAAKVFEEFGISYHVDIVSAHRTPDWMHKFAKQAESKGFKIIIAGAGGSAHLAGMVSGLTTLPVIGVPIMTSKLDGLDSLLSMGMMPPGVPTDIAPINGAKNAALQAARILALSNPDLRKKVKEYTRKQEKEVLKKAASLRRVGVQAYLKKMRNG